MSTNFRGKHFIALSDFTRDEIDRMLDVSLDLKRKFATGEVTDYLKNQTGALMFFEESTRTRNSMEMGIAQLGGHANFLDTSTMQISHGEVAKDTAVILSRFGHFIACRNCFYNIGNKYLREMAEHSTVPVMNLQCDLYNPMQGLADLMTMKEKLVDLKRKKVSIIWAYAKSHKKPISVPLTQTLLFPRYGMDVTLAYPEGYQLPEWVINKAKAYAEEHDGTLTITHDQDAAYKNADIVIPKNWGCWVTHPEDSGEELLEANKHWKCTQEKMDLTNRAYYMHALPADRGREVDNEIIDGPQSIVYDEAENRLHTAKAIMLLTMGGK